MRSDNTRLGSSLLIGILVLAAVPPGTAKADLVFAQKVIQTGKVKTGPILSRTFQFRNTGRETIEILDTRTACKCVIPKLAKRVYAPGEGGTIDFQVETLSSAAGEKRWVAYISYRDGKKVKQTYIELRTTLETEVSVQPAKVAMRVRSTFQQTFKVYDRRKTPLTVVAVDATSPHLRVRKKERTKENGRWLTPVELDVTQALPDGTHREYLVLYTDDVEYRELKVPVTIVKGSGRATVAPKRLYVTLKRDKTNPTKLLVVRSPNSDQQVVIKDVLTHHPAVQCKWNAKSKTTAVVKVTFDPKRVRSGGFQTSVQIILSQPSASVLTVRIRGQVAD
ncbi:MAG: DUF1573 domain-containing protein [Gemmataceae bacterium]